MREMKDSGIEWIGEIPQNWKYCKQKYELKLINGRAYSDTEFEDDGKYRVLRVGNLFSNPVWYTSSLELNADKYCEYGDLLYSWSMSYAPVIWDGEKVIYHYHIWKVKLNSGLDKKFAFYYLMSLTNALKAEIHETTMGFITMGIMNNSYIAFPDINEQKRIADILDYKCAEIDALTSDIQDQIDTLVQYKRSVITEAVTKGLNPNAETKDSGIVWIGKVPAKWRVENPKYHFTQRQERATKEMVQLTASQKYGVVTQAEYMELTGARVVVVQKDFDILKKVCAGDFVIHMRSFQGGLEYSTKTGSISSAYVMLIPKESIVEPRYYRWFFKSSAYIDALSSTSNLVRDGQAMRWANFIQLPITIPPADEQTQIADFLDAKCAEINSIIASKKAQLETLDAYKKSLIFEYVTGKKEVPETVTVVSINPHVPLLAMVVDMLKKPRGEVVDQKLLYLCDVYLGLGLSTQYYRWDYGPFDKQLYSYIDTLVSNGWYKVNIQNKAKVLVRAENHAEALEMYGNQLAQNKSDIEKLVQYFGEMRVSEIERFATLFAVWNDFIIDGIPAPSDYQIIDDVLTNWGPTKGRFSRDTWQNTLMKMKRDGIIPKGLGLHTLPKPEGGKSDA